MVDSNIRGVYLVQGIAINTVYSLGMWGKIAGTS